MLRRSLLLLALPTILGAAAAQSLLAGAWEGAIDPSDLDLHVRVEFDVDDDGTTGTLDVPLQGAHDLELADVEFAADGTVRFAAPDLPRDATFEGRLAGHVLQGVFRQGAVAVPFRLERVPRLDGVATPEGWPGTWRGRLAPGAVDFELVLRLEDRDGRLVGTLDMPSQGLRDLPVRTVSASGDGTTVEVPALPADARFGLRLVDGELVGTFEQEGVRFPLTLRREAPADD